MWFGGRGGGFFLFGFWSVKPDDSCSSRHKALARIVNFGGVGALGKNHIGHKVCVTPVFLVGVAGGAGGGTGKKILSVFGNGKFKLGFTWQPVVPNLKEHHVEVFI